jgi:hypothetical protein
METQTQEAPTQTQKAPATEAPSQTRPVVEPTPIDPATLAVVIDVLNAQSNTVRIANAQAYKDKLAIAEPFLDKENGGVLPGVYEAHKDNPALVEASNTHQAKHPEYIKSVAERDTRKQEKAALVAKIGDKPDPAVTVTLLAVLRAQAKLDPKIEPEVYKTKLAEVAHLLDPQKGGLNEIAFAVYGKEPGIEEAAAAIRKANRKAEVSTAKKSVTSGSTQSRRR